MEKGIQGKKGKKRKKQIKYVPQSMFGLLPCPFLFFSSMKIT
jgi:hypothetical protein